MLKNVVWKISPRETLHEVINFPNLNPVILQLLKKRGVESRDQIEVFLDSKIEDLYNPMLMKDMEKAVERINVALKKSERITVYGDYDVDGITSTCIILKTLKKLGGNVDYYIPSRLDEGYGLNMDSIEKIQRRGTTLIITVDNGISSFEEVEYAKTLGIDVIITDHHEPQNQIPQAAAVVNPKQRNCNYPFKNLAGVGVALKLAHALTNFDQQTLEENLELAALGTIADIVPLLDENRIIAKHGLIHMEKTHNKGLKAMKSLLNISDIHLDTTKVSFLLAPRLNAVGRIYTAEIAVELLLTEDETRAFELAQTLEDINQERQAIESKILNQAREMIERDLELDEDRVIVVSSQEWHPGVIGIVASRLVEIYNRPCILIALDGEEGRGSGRSVPGFNIFEALSQFSHLLKRYGGHEQAAGFSISVDNIELFKEEINILARRILKRNYTPELDIDMELKEEDITLDLAAQIELLEPFGYGNPKPVFMCKNFCVDHIRTVGNEDRHLKLNLKKKQKQIAAIGFNLGLYKEELYMAPVMDIAFHLEVNRWQGLMEPQLKIKDIKIPYLQDELLIKIEEGYYKRFYSAFKSEMIKLSLSDHLPDMDSTEVIKNEDNLEKNEYVKELFLKERRVLVIINTPYQAWRLLEYLKGMEDIKNDTGVFFCLNPDIDSGKKNIILINPVDTCCKENADDIVFYDAPFSAQIYGMRLKNMSCGSTIHVIFKKTDFRFNHMVCHKMLPEIEDIRKIYSLLDRMSANKLRFIMNINDFNTKLRRYIDFDLHYMGLVNVFKVFKEMGIIDFKIKHGFVQIDKQNDHPQKASLETSDTYRRFVFIKKKLKEFEQLQGGI
ncbi:MAG TPA: single-stranded-DNA-specific exonuclease RecJ [Thermoanaerobacterales bacterium]|nr:single-stranded-DNA-specific exonuclease RecJ [Thermoanaerobacterales bacterium]